MFDNEFELMYALHGRHVGDGGERRDESRKLLGMDLVKDADHIQCPRAFSEERVTTDVEEVELSHIKRR